MTSSCKISPDFLAGPPPALRKSKINFASAGLPEYTNAYAVLLDGVLTKEECNQLLTAAEATTNGTWERAMINVGGGQQALAEGTRKCGRIILDDYELMAKVWARIEPAVPEIHRLEDWPDVTGPATQDRVWVLTRLNERARFLKYVGGEYFKGMTTVSPLLFNLLIFAAHYDGMYETPIGTERSYFTLHLYLNDTVGNDGQILLEGGATSFYSWDMDHSLYIEPKCGRVLLFQQRDLLHSGDDVTKGTKYTMRTDVMYSLENGLGQGPDGG